MPDPALHKVALQKSRSGIWRDSVGWKYLSEMLSKLLPHQPVLIGSGENARTGIVVKVDEGSRTAMVALDQTEPTAGGGPIIRSFRFEELTPLA